MGWYNASWINRIAITVDHTKVGASLTNFPVYLDLSKLPAAFFSNVRSDGGDIRMTESDGTTEVAREIVSIDTVGKTGEVHFNASSLSNSTDTIFYIYYGNASATNYADNATYGKYNVWDSNYLAVYHMEGNSNDSTSNARNGTDTSVTYAAANGKLGKGASFNGSTSKIALSATNLPTTGAYTIEAWMYCTDTTGSANAIMGYGPTGTTNNCNVFRTGTIYGLTNYWWGNDAVSGNNAWVASTWYSVIAKWDTSTRTILSNNSSVYSAAASGLSAQQNNAFIGTDAGNEFFHGNLDEVRISKIARSADWLSTQYNNQNSSSTFYTIGGQEIQSTGGIHGTLSMMGIGN